jgi:hypothetical protein
MAKASTLGKKAGVMILVIITMITIASAAPLEITIEEKVNTTATPQEYTGGGPTFTYTTNVTGYVNITNTGQDPIYDIWIALNLTNITDSCQHYWNNTTVTVTVGNSVTIPDRINKAGVFNTSNANCFVHIPLLRPNQTVSVFYDVDDSSMVIANGAPFIIEEKYDPPKIPARGEYTWTVYFNVSLNETWWSKTALNTLNGNNVTLNITKYLSNNTSHFGSYKWVTLGPIANQQNISGVAPQSVNFFDSPYTNNAPNTAMNLTGIQLTTSNRYCNVSFQVTGNYSNSTAAPHYFEPFGFAVFEFNLTYGNISGSYVVDVFAIGNASINVTKDGPYLDENGNTWWRGNATITNTASGLSYVVTNVTMWATQQGSFNNLVSGSFKCENSSNTETGNVICEYNSSTLPKELNQSNPSIMLPGVDNWMNFSYNQVPIIWANATFKLIKSPTHGWGTNSTIFNDFNATYGSNFIVIEKIYIIGTYLVKVTKHVKFNESASINGNNVFDIYLVVENIGGNYSPYVYVYDLIPENFEEFNWDYNWLTLNDGDWVNNSSMFAGNGSVNNPMSDYRLGLYWRLNPLAPGAVGDGDYTNTTAIESNQSVVIFYQLNGTGDFRVLDVFIVGIDPMYSLNEQTSPKITLVGGAKATNYETALATFAFAGFGILLFALRRNGRNGE